MDLDRILIAAMSVFTTFVVRRKRLAGRERRPEKRQHMRLAHVTASPGQAAKALIEY